MSNVVVFGASLNACEESSQWQQGIGLLSCLQLQNLQLNLNLGPETDGISKVPDRAIGEILKHTNLPGVNIWDPQEGCTQIGQMWIMDIGCVSPHHPPW